MFNVKRILLAIWNAFLSIFSFFFFKKESVPQKDPDELPLIASEKDSDISLSLSESRSTTPEPYTEPYNQNSPTYTSFDSSIDHEDYGDILYQIFSAEILSESQSEAILRELQIAHQDVTLDVEATDWFRNDRNLSQDLHNNTFHRFDAVPVR